MALAPRARFAKRDAVNRHLRRLRLVADEDVVHMLIQARVACVTAVFWFRRACCIHKARPFAATELAPLRNILRNGFFLIQGLAMGVSFV
jgi:hypothetical protein